MCVLHCARHLVSPPEKPNPKFLALAQALLADHAFAGHWGAERILEEASSCASAIWEPRLPAGDGMPLLEDFTRHFESLGFTPGNVESKAIPRSAALSFSDKHLGEFSRPTDDGWQRLIVGVNDADADSEYFKCNVSAGIRRESVEMIFTQVFGEGIRKAETFFFSPAIFLRDRANDFAVTSERLIVELPGLVEQLAMPVLDLASDLNGLDVVMNDPPRFPFAYPLHPLTPQNLADSFINFGRQSCLKTLIVSKLAKSPNFEARVAALRAFVRTRVDVSEDDLDRLLAHLRSADQSSEP